MVYNLESLITEMPHDETTDMDRKSTLEIIKIMNREDQKVALAVEKEIPNIERAVERIIHSFRQGGRLIYIGAGSSGRLGILDAAECPPTFGTPQEQVVGIIAGGRQALVDAVEGAEDDEEQGKKDLMVMDLKKEDTVVGIAASGRTPYVLGALNYAREVGAATVSLTCNPNAKMSQIAEISIEPVVGPEILTGSTRLKAGTAQKMVLNMISTAAMIGIGKVYKNLMVDVQATNEKLVERAKRIIMTATGVSYEQARQALEQAKGSPKAAVVMIQTGCTYREALERIELGDGFVHKAIQLRKGEFL